MSLRLAPVVWPYLATAIVMAVIAAGGRAWLARLRAEGVAGLWPPLYGLPMATFGADHYTYSASIGTIVPAWLPWHEFWVLFVGSCLLAGGFALALRQRPLLAVGLFGTMMWLFVALMHVPGVAGAPGDRFAWGILSRDSTFGAGALALVAARRGWPGHRLAVTLTRLWMGAAAVFWAVEQVLHPTYRPGIALEQLMPAWMPLVTPIAWLSAAALLAAGLGLLSGRATRRSAVFLALAFVAFAVVLGVPITIGAPADVGGLNYFGDNLMMAGAAACLAAAVMAQATLAARAPGVAGPEPAAQR